MAQTKQYSNKKYYFNKQLDKTLSYISINSDDGSERFFSKNFQDRYDFDKIYNEGIKVGKGSNTRLVTGFEATSIMLKKLNHYSSDLFKKKQYIKNYTDSLVKNGIFGANSEEIKEIKAQLNSIDKKLMGYAIKKNYLKQINIFYTERDPNEVRKEITNIFKGQDLKDSIVKAYLNDKIAQHKAMLFEEAINGKKKGKKKSKKKGKKRK